MCDPAHASRNENRSHRQGRHVRLTVTPIPSPRSGLPGDTGVVLDVAAPGVLQADMALGLLRRFRSGANWRQAPRTTPKRPGGVHAGRAAVVGVEATNDTAGSSPWSALVPCMYWQVVPPTVVSRGRGPCALRCVLSRLGSGDSPDTRWPRCSCGSRSLRIGR